MVTGVIVSARGTEPLHVEMRSLSRRLLPELPLKPDMTPVT
jgi:hypothetical protein